MKMKEKNIRSIGTPPYRAEPPFIGFEFPSAMVNGGDLLYPIIISSDGVEDAFNISRSWFRRGSEDFIVREIVRAVVQSVNRALNEEFRSNQMEESR